MNLLARKDSGPYLLFAAIGASGGRKAGIEGEDTPGVTDAVGFLRRVNSGDHTCPGKHVAVIGGGNVAVDSARTALRLGARSVTIVYRRSGKEMPAFSEEIQEAVKEGIIIKTHTAPVRILQSGRDVSGIECIKTRQAEADQDGRRRPEPVAGSEFEIPCDAVITAIGQQVLSDCQKAGFEIRCDSGGRIIIDPAIMQTCIENLFAAGDAVTGPATVIEAVASGRRVAEGIRNYLENRQAQPEPKWTAPQQEADWMPFSKNQTRLARAQPLFLPAEECKTCFDEVCKGFGTDDVYYEASRCLNCGGCCECMECVRVCEAGAIDHLMKAEEIQINAGAIILATGYDVLDPTPMGRYGYGRYPNVFTSLEFERLSNATGPTGGQILMRDENWQFSRPPGSVALLHCIGSRDVNYHEYCSRVCCMYALKYSHLIKEKVGHHVQVYDFYIDMRCFGKNCEEFYKRCQQEGTVFIRGKVAEITDEARSPEEEGRLVAVAEDTLLGEPIRVAVDMAVLCVAMEARADAPEVSRFFGISQGSDGFYLESHPKLGPLETATDGVFAAGSCTGRKDISDSVIYSGSAALNASLILHNAGGSIRACT